MTYNIILERFQGPLDLLLHLIESAKVDIYDIPINEITNQYLEYIENMKTLDLEVTSDFLVMASTLLEIKSRNLLPKAVSEDDEDEVDPQEELIKQLIEYKRFKGISKILGDLEKKQLDVYYKPREDLNAYENNQEVDLDLDVELLASLFYEFLNKFEDKTPNINIEDIYGDEYYVDEYIDVILDGLKNKDKLKFSSLFKAENIREIVVLFLATLELIRMDKISVVQDYLYSDIIIRKKAGK